MLKCPIKAFKIQLKLMLSAGTPLLHKNTLLTKEKK